MMVSFSKLISLQNLEEANEHHLSNVPAQFVFPDIFAILWFFGCCKDRSKKCTRTIERQKQNTIFFRFLNQYLLDNDVKISTEALFGKRKSLLEGLKDRIKANAYDEDPLRYLGIGYT